MNHRSHTRTPSAGRRPAAAGLAFSAALLLLIAPAAAAQARLTEEASKQLRAQAEASSRAFMEGNFERLADLTHPKVVESMGGREKMAEFVRKDVAEGRSQGFETLSYAPAAEPTQVLRVGRQLYAVLPAKLRMSTPEGVYVSESFLIAVSADDGKNWRFVSGAAADAATLKLLLPEAAGRLKLPPARHYPEAEKKP